MRAQTPIRLIQLTDCHLMADVDDDLLGIVTDVTLDHVLALPVWRQPLDILLCTGDLSQDDTVASYQRLQHKLRKIEAIKCFVPGNHDDMGVMSQVLANERLGDQYVDMEGWRIIVLDSQWPGHVSGQLGAEQLAWLAEALLACKDRYVLIALHHHVYPIDVAWIDAWALQQPEALQAVLGQHGHIKAVLSGHVHHASEQWHGGVRWLTSPSSCFQTDASRGADFAPSMEQPGVRELLLYPDGQVMTMVHRTDAAPLHFDKIIRGY